MTQQKRNKAIEKITSCKIKLEILKIIVDSQQHFHTLLLSKIN